MKHIGCARQYLVGLARSFTPKLVGTVIVASAMSAHAFAQTSLRAGEVSLDSLLNTRISTAAKYLQTTAEAAASITIVSAEDIRKQGYSNLQEVLESVPGMYVTNAITRIWARVVSVVRRISTIAFSCLSMDTH